MAPVTASFRPPTPTKERSLDADAVRRDIETWIDRAVIGWGLCPFAAPVVRAAQMRIVVRDDAEVSAMLEAVIDELVAVAAPEATVRTTLIVAPVALADFDELLDAAALIDDVIDRVGLRGKIQLAHFHPDYLFEGAATDDLANWTNRAPHPILHLLREDDVAEAVARYPDADGIPERNVARLRGMSLDAIMAACRPR